MWGSSYWKEVKLPIPHSEMEFQCSCNAIHFSAIIAVSGIQQVEPKMQLQFMGSNGRHLDF